MSERITMKDVPLEELVITPGSACQGCGAALAARLAFKALGPNTIRHSIPACPDNVTRTPTSGGEFEAGGDHVTGTWRGLKAIGREDVQVVGFYGDGGVYDIGFQSISGAAIRNENVLIICKNNEAYMNTGGQVSGATPLLAMTTTTPVGPMSRGKPYNRKNTPMIFAMHGVPYVATASIAFPTDLIAKVQYTKKVRGFKFIDIQTPCPTGWRFDPSKTIEVARLAVQTGFWPLYEIIDGRKFRLNYKPRELKPVGEYLKLQGRFRHLTEDEIEEIQREVTEYWERLLKLDERGEFIF
jgi:pyruvate/2-oxoacid:ferredoxin oxidoreductase beta subunit